MPNGSSWLRSSQSQEQSHPASRSRDERLSMASSTSCERAAHGDRCPMICPTEKPCIIISASGNSMAPGKQRWPAYAERCEPRWAETRNPVRPSSLANRSKPVPCEAANAASTVEKKIWGRKRHLLVDTQGFLLAVKVHAANLTDRLGARLLLQKLQGRFPRLCHLFADSGYTGPLLEWITLHLGWQTEIVSQPLNKPPQQWEWEAVLLDGEIVPRPKPKGRGFQLQHHRWKVERTFAWLIRFRRLARDYEGLPSSSEALIQIASIRLFLTRLTPFRPLRT